MTSNLSMNPEQIEDLAAAYANQWLESIDYLTIHEMLEDDMLEYTDDDAEAIFDLVTTRAVKFA